MLSIITLSTFAFMSVSQSDLITSDSGVYSVSNAENHTNLSVVNLEHTVAPIVLDKQEAPVAPKAPEVDEPMTSWEAKAITNPSYRTNMIVLITLAVVAQVLLISALITIAYRRKNMYKK